MCENSILLLPRTAPTWHSWLTFQSTSPTPLRARSYLRARSRWQLLSHALLSAIDYHVLFLTRFIIRRERNMTNRSHAPPALAPPLAFRSPTAHNPFPRHGFFASAFGTPTLPRLVGWGFGGFCTRMYTKRAPKQSPRNLVYPPISNTSKLGCFFQIRFLRYPAGCSQLIQNSRSWR
jgi:hypothetical protein